MADNQDRINQIKQEDAIQRNLSKILQDRITTTGNLTKAQRELVDSTAGVQDLESKILAVQEEKEEVQFIALAKENHLFLIFHLID